MCLVWHVTLGQASQVCYHRFAEFLLLVNPSFILSRSLLLASQSWAEKKFASMEQEFWVPNSVFDATTFASNLISKHEVNCASFLFCAAVLICAHWKRKMRSLAFVSLARSLADHFARWIFIVQQGQRQKKHLLARPDRFLSFVPNFIASHPPPLTSGKVEFVIFAPNELTSQSSTSSLVRFEQLRHYSPLMISPALLRRRRFRPATLSSQSEPEAKASNEIENFSLARFMAIGWPGFPLRVPLGRSPH